MDKLVADPWWAALVVLITQIIFLYARTLNIMFIAKNRFIPSLITSNIVGITWLLSIAIGANAVLTMQWQPILAHVIGSTIGVIMGFKLKRHVPKESIK